MILELLTTYGICFTFQHTKLLNKPRDWICNRVTFIDELLSCSFCTGAWSGILAYLLLSVPSSAFKWNMLFVYFFAGAAFCYFMDCITDYLEIANNLYNKDD